MTSDTHMFPLHGAPNYRSPDSVGSHAVIPADNCIARWEDEGGLHNQPEWQDENDLLTHSPLETHLSNASNLLNAGHIDCAVTELASAAERLKNYNEMVAKSMNDTIMQLSTDGGYFGKPHPKTLHLIRLRQQL